MRGGETDQMFTFGAAGAPRCWTLYATDVKMFWWSGMMEGWFGSKLVLLML